MSFGTMIKSAVFATGRFVVKHAPEELTIAGVGVGVAAGVTACKKTLTVNDILEQHKKKMYPCEMRARVLSGEATEEDNAIIDDLSDNEKKLFDSTLNKKAIFIDRAKENLRFACDLARHYAIPLIMAISAIALIFCGFKILQGRYDAAIALASSIATAFANYREAVVKDQGAEVDAMYMKGEYREKTQVKEGRKTVEKEEIKSTGKVADPYSFIISPKTSGLWDNDFSLMQANIAAAGHSVNEILERRGIITLNDIYRAYQMKNDKGEPLYTAAGQLAGLVWRKADETGDGDFQYEPDIDILRQGISENAEPIDYIWVKPNVMPSILDYMPKNNIDAGVSKDKACADTPDTLQYMPEGVLV